MLSRLVSFIIYFFVFITISISADEWIIQDIRLEGLQRVSNGSVFSAINIGIGDKIDEFEVTKTTKDIYKLGYFKDINVSREGRVLVFTLTENPVISKISFKGNDTIKTEDLEKGMAEVGLAQGEIFQKSLFENLKTELEKQYFAKGFYSAIVNISTVDESLNKIRLKINITEGKQSAIKNFNLVGNTAFSDKTLNNLLLLHKTSFWSFLTDDDKYVKEKLVADIEKLTSYYMDRGYLNVKIPDTSVALSDDKKAVFVTLNIDEGDIYKINDISYFGNYEISDKELQAITFLKKGAIFSRKALTNTSDFIKRRLGDDGYAFAKVEPQTTINSDDKIDIRFVIDIGEQYFVDKISFVGNTKTKDEVLRRELMQLEGMVASTYLIEQSKVKLERLGFFQSVKYDIAQSSTQNNMLNVTYTIEERQLGSINATLGYGQSTGMVFGFGISQDNFYGTGNSVSFGLNKSEYQTRYNFSIFNPYITKNGVSGGFNMFYRVVDYEKVKNNLTSYAMDTFGLGFTLGFPVAENTRINYSLKAQKDKIYTGRYLVDEIYDFIKVEGSKYMNYRASLSLVNSTLNKGVFPTDGHRSSITFDTTLPNSDLSFYKIDVESQRYFELSEQYSLRFHGRLGYGDTLNKNREYPFFMHYHSGGYDSVRGFEDSALGPTSTPSTGKKPGTSFNPYQRNQPFGGNALVEGGAELIVPTPFADDQKSLRTTIFFDVGNVFSTTCSTEQKLRDSTCNVSIDNLATSAGTSLTWLTPMGPLKFSWAKPIKNVDSKSTQYFQFSLGSTF